MPYKDPEKRKEYLRQYNNEWYQKNKEARRKQIYASRRRKIDWFYNEYKPTLVCSKCGFSDYRAIEFHHIVPLNDHSSRMRIADLLMQKGWSIKRVIKYIEENIEILCANCHRIAHYESNIDKSDPIT